MYLPKYYIQDQLSKIAAIRIEISSLVGKFKLSQNRDVVDRLNVAKAYKPKNKDDLVGFILNK